MMTRFSTAAILPIAMTSLLVGCVSTSRVDGLEKRIHELENGQEQEREELRSQIETAKKQVAEMETVLEAATDVVKRNSADIGLQVRDLRKDIQALQGEIAEVRNASSQTNKELEQRLQQFARKAGVDVPIDPALIPNEQDKHFKVAIRAHQNSDHTVARGLFREYLKRYPNDPLAGEAQYRLGASYLKQGQPATALGEYRLVITKHAQSDAVNRTLLEMGYAFWGLHSCDDARAALNALIKRAPKSEEAAEAKKKLAAWKRPPSGYCSE